MHIKKKLIPSHLATIEMCSVSLTTWWTLVWHSLPKMFTDNNSTVYLKLDVPLHARPDQNRHSPSLRIRFAFYEPRRYLIRWAVVIRRRAFPKNSPYLRSTREFFTARWDGSMKFTPTTWGPQKKTCT